MRGHTLRCSRRQRACAYLNLVAFGVGAAVDTCVGMDVDVDVDIVIVVIVVVVVAV